MDHSTASKSCSKCKAEKPLAAFNKQAKSRDGHHYYCRDCQSAYVRANRSQYTANSRRWEKSNPEKVSAKLSRWRADNAEHVSGYKRQYRESNQEAVLEYDRRYYADNVEARREQSRLLNQEWRSSNPEKIRLKDERRRAMKRDAYVEDVRLYFLLERDGYQCVVCRGAIDPVLRHPHLGSASLEHIVPLVRGGMHSYLNCAPSHLGCNISKGSKLLEEM